MTKFPDYLYKNILSLIIKQIYVYNPIVSFEPFSSELINYILVSKKWFDECSAILGDNINTKNYNILKSFSNINNKNKNNNNNNNNNHDHNNYNDNDNNQDYKLLSTKRNYGNLIKVYKSMHSFIMDSRSSNHINDLSIYKPFKKVLIKIQKNEIKNISNLKLDNYPENFQFDLDLSLNDETSAFLLNNSGCSKYRVNLIKVSGLITTQLDEFISFCSLLLNLNSRHIFIMTIPNTHLDYSILFSSPTLKSISIINYDHVEPLDIAKINNNNTQLELLEVSLNFTDIIGFDSNLINLDTYGQIINNAFNTGNYSLKNISTLKEDLDLMAHTLSNNSSITQLNIKTFNYDIPKKNNSKLKCDLITSVFSKILSNSKSNIKILKLESYGFIIDDPLFISTLSNNKTINTLLFYNINIENIFKIVLNQNKTIKHLVLLNCSNTISGNLDTISKYYSGNIDLYSITIILPDKRLIERTLKIFESLPNSPKEIKLYSIDSKTVTTKILNSK